MRPQITTLAAAVALAGAALAPGAAGAAGELRTAAQLASYCGGDPGTEAGAVGRVFCYGYMTGVMQLHREMVADIPELEPGACPDYTVSREELAAVYVNYLAANADRGAEPPLSVLGDAAAAEWPCN